MRDAEIHVSEEGGVVASPVAGPFPRAGKGGAANDEGAFPGDGGKEGVVRCVEDLVAKEVVDVIFEGAVVVGGVGGYSVGGEVALDIVDNVGGVVDIAGARGGGGTEVGDWCCSGVRVGGQGGLH